MNWDAFEKRAYSYAHETRELGRDYSENAKRTPIGGIKSSLVGAGIGAVGGGLLGAVHGASRGSAMAGGALGALLGGGFGAGMGALSAMADKLGIEESKRIMAMPKKEREEYLQHLAREGEITSQEARDWRRVHFQEFREQRRHNERMAK